MLVRLIEDDLKRNERVIVYTLIRGAILFHTILIYNTICISHNVYIYIYIYIYIYNLYYNYLICIIYIM